MKQKFQILKNSKKFSKSSQKWLRRQINDPLVMQAKIDGFLSRAAYKIIEIDNKFKIFKKNHLVIDLGAAPGGWSQVAVKKVGNNNVIALDLLPMQPISGIISMQLDFFSEEAKEAIIQQIKTNSPRQSKCNVVMSDMAANATGNSNTDHLRIINLLEEALNLAIIVLAKNGSFIGKLFQGGSSQLIVQNLQQYFSKVSYFKPQSSRKDSSEVYLVATGFKGN
jgi:23S rRNA (uridine2552-2'-O)-methyltransferase